MEELGIECRIGHPAKINQAETPSKSKSLEKAQRKSLQIETIWRPHDHRLLLKATRARTGLPSLSAFATGTRIAHRNS
jgi:hypothetical protein